MVAVAGAGAAALTTAVGLHALRAALGDRRGSCHGAASVDGALVVAHAEGRVRVVRARRLGLVVCELDGSPARFVAVGARQVVALLFMMDHLRDQTFVVAVWAFAAGAGARRRPPVRVNVPPFGVAVLVLVPALLGYGVAASSWIDDSIHGAEVAPRGQHDRRPERPVVPRRPPTTSAG